MEFVIETKIQNGWIDEGKPTAEILYDLRVVTIDEDNDMYEEWLGTFKSESEARRYADFWKNHKNEVRFIL